MVKTILVVGVIEKHLGSFRLVPAAAEAVEIRSAEISCAKHIEKIRVSAGLSGRFRVEVSEQREGARVVSKYKVVGVIGNQPTENPEAAQQVQSHREPTTMNSQTFVHPYNFVRLPSAEALEYALNLENTIFKRGPSATHDSYDANLKSGFIDCELTTHTHWFIPDPRKVHVEKAIKHKSLGYFTLEPVEPWATEIPKQDTSIPAIPASSLRGVIRSIFETATLSCFSVFDDVEVEFRAARILDDQNYIPARVVSISDSGANLQLLSSRISPNEVNGATQKVYVIKGSGINARFDEFAGVLKSNPKIMSGARVLALVDSSSSTHRAPLTYRFRTAKHVFEIPDSLQSHDDVNNPAALAFLNDAVAKCAHGDLFVFGYFSRTGWNIENKHDEKVFFVTGKYNDIRLPSDEESLTKRLAEFLSDQSITATAKKEVVGKANRSLQRYAERHREELLPTPRKLTTGSGIKLSDYIVPNARLRKGDLVFVLRDADLLRRLNSRLIDEFDATGQAEPLADNDVAIVQPPGLARLQWIKWLYGRAGETKSLFGVMGRLVIDVRSPESLLPLVLGQYTAVGEKVNFGLGRYAIEETQSALPAGVPSFLRATRGRSLVELAMEETAIESEAERLGEPVVAVRRLAKQILQQGEAYVPQPIERFLLPSEKPRLLAVPTRAERAVQRGVHELLSPVLDRFLSDSCLAYRKGLGRKTAADRIQRAYREGWRWALRSDFHHFFDSIDHQLLREKLEVYIQDPAMVGLLMKWVESGAPQPGRGLPTGAVIAPLLANLFLEQFDHQVAEDQGHLVRYGDDFVLLFRDPARGRRVLERAGALAEQLKLHLNDEKTKLLELDRTPFDFLGFRFFSEKGWQFRGDGLQQIEDLGWHEAPKGRVATVRHGLPDEAGLEATRAGTWIVGPQIDWLGIEGQDIVCRSQQLGTEDRFERRRVGELIVLGMPTLDRSLFRQRREDPLEILLADEAGRWICALTDEPPLELPQLVRAQVELSVDATRSLEIAKRLIAAKLRNHAVLSQAYPARNASGKLSENLRTLAEKVLASGTQEEMLGYEGAAASAWYRELAGRIDRRFTFEKRVHPHAEDPVNAMLNLAQTILHRVLTLCLVREGFATSLGILHVESERHAALASDLQEPFRHLMDRVVIELTYTLSPGEFHPTSQGPMGMRMEAGTYRTVVAAVFRMLATQTITAGQEAPRSYRRHIDTMARGLHRHLLNREAMLRVFEYRY